MINLRFLKFLLVLAFSPIRPSKQIVCFSSLLSNYYYVILLVLLLVFIYSACIHDNILLVLTFLLIYFISLCMEKGKKSKFLRFETRTYTKQQNTILIDTDFVISVVSRRIKNFASIRSCFSLILMIFRRFFRFLVAPIKTKAFF